MKCTTVFQPYASRIVAGDKTIDTRLRPTDYRGRLAIYAADRPLKNARALHGLAGCICPGAEGLPGAPLVAPYEIATICDVHGDFLPFGAIIGTCMLVDCVPITTRQRREHGKPDPTGAIWLSAKGSWLVDAREDLYRPITGQLEYGDFTPGRWAWMLEDAKPTTARCPACWDRPPNAAPGTCVDIDGGWWHEPGSCRYCAGACPVCKGGTRRVDPIHLDMNTDLWDVEL